MIKRIPSPAARAAALALSAMMLAGCNTLTRISEIGQAPSLTPTDNPVRQPGYRAVTMPMPTPVAPSPSANSLWRPGARAFFKDQRASEIGDILTIVVDIGDKAKLENKTSRSRDNSETAGLPRMLGYEQSLNRILPEAISPSSLVDLSSASGSEGEGELERGEQVELTVAAVITQILPNGNLVIAGRQEVRVNHELRELTVTGVIRPEDISSGNTITSEKIAEARISYGGRGTISDVQQPRYGQQLFDIVFPF